MHKCFNDYWDPNLSRTHRYHQFPAARGHKSALVAALSAAMFALGVVFTCGGGIHAFTLFNAAAPSWNLLLFTLLEVVAVAWIYGTDNVVKNLAGAFLFHPVTNNTTG